jgi:tryptophan synthase alpha chain
MPPEESGVLQKIMRRYGLGRVFIVSELTPPERMRRIASQVDSFVYVVSRLGTTGAGRSLSGSIAFTIRHLKKITPKPLAVGFGISTPAHVKAVRAACADAVIVGSALVALVEAHTDNRKKLPALLARKVAAFKSATR